MILNTATICLSWRALRRIFEIKKINYADACGSKNQVKVRLKMNRPLHSWVKTKLIFLKIVFFLNNLKVKKKKIGSNLIWLLTF